MNKTLTQLLDELAGGGTVIASETAFHGKPHLSLMGQVTLAEAAPVLAIAALKDLSRSQLMRALVVLAGPAIAELVAELPEHERELFSNLVKAVRMTGGAPADFEAAKRHLIGKPAKVKVRASSVKRSGARAAMGEVCGLGNPPAGVKDWSLRPAVKGEEK